MDQILPQVKCELGLAFLPKLTAQQALQQREIVQIPQQEIIPERQICIVYDQHPLEYRHPEIKEYNN